MSSEEELIAALMEVKKDLTKIENKFKEYRQRCVDRDLKDITTANRLVVQGIRLKHAEPIYKNAFDLLPDDFKKMAKRDDLCVAWEKCMNHLKRKSEFLTTELRIKHNVFLDNIKPKQENFVRVKNAHAQAKEDLKQEKIDRQKTENDKKQELLAHRRSVNGILDELMEIANKWKDPKKKGEDGGNVTVEADNKENSPHVPRSPAAQQ